MNLILLNYSYLDLAYYALLTFTYILFIVNSKKFKFNQSIWFFIAFSAMITTEIISSIQLIKYNTYNIFSYQLGIDLIAGFFIMSFYYALANRKKRVLKWAIAYLAFNSIALLVSFIFSADFFDFCLTLYHNFRFFFFVNLAFFLVVLLNFTFETFNSDKVFNIKYYFPFWVTISLLIMYIGKLPNFVMLGTEAEDLQLFDFLNSIINLISYLILILGISLNKNIVFEYKNSERLSEGRKSIH